MRRRAAITATVALAASTAMLLDRMRRELESTGALTDETVAAMYSAYVAQAAMTAFAARRRAAPLPLPAEGAAAVGGAAAAVGAGLWIAGVSRFAGPRQLSGTEIGGLVTGGVYRYSRNPQYLGYLLVLGGLGVARRSAAVLALAAPVGLAFRWWIPIEEGHLEREVGAPYVAYRRHTARWLGRPRNAGPG